MMMHSAARTVLKCSRTIRSPSLLRCSLHTERKIEELGYTLPTMPRALGVYLPSVRTGNYVHTAGHIPFTEDMKGIRTGKVSVEYSTEEAAKIAEWVALELIATLKETVGDLDKIKRIVKVVGFVNAPAVGVNALPRNVPVEIELIAEIEAE